MHKKVLAERRNITKEVKNILFSVLELRILHCDIAIVPILTQEKR